MISGISLLQAVGLALLAGVSFTVSTALKLLLEREYTDWASGFARLLTRLAGRIYRNRQAEWWADLLYAQAVERETGIYKAASWLGSAPVFALRNAVAAFSGRSHGLVILLLLWLIRTTLQQESSEFQQTKDLLTEDLRRIKQRTLEEDLAFTKLLSMEADAQRVFELGQRVFDKERAQANEDLMRDLSSRHRLSQ